MWAPHALLRRCLPVTVRIGPGVSCHVRALAEFALSVGPRVAAVVVGRIPVRQNKVLARLKVAPEKIAVEDAVRVQVR